MSFRYGLVFFLTATYVNSTQLHAQVDMSAEWQELLDALVPAVQSGNTDDIAQTLTGDVEVRHECLSCWRYPFLTTQLTDHNWFERYIGPTAIEVGSLLSIDSNCARFAEDLQALEDNQSAALSRVCLEEGGARLELTQWFVPPSEPPPCSGHYVDDRDRLEGYVFGGLEFELEADDGYPGAVRFWPHPFEDNRVLVGGEIDRTTNRIWTFDCSDLKAEPEVFLELEGADFAHAELVSGLRYNDDDGFRIYYTSQHGIGMLDALIDDFPLHTAVRYVTTAVLLDDPAFGGMQTDFVAGLSPDRRMLEILRGDRDGREGEWGMEQLRVQLDTNGTSVAAPYAPTPVFAATVDATGTLWIAADQLYRSFDLGLSFEQVIPYDVDYGPYDERWAFVAPMFSVQADSLRPGHLLAYRGRLTDQNIYFDYVEHELYRTVDDGATWQRIDISCEDGPGHEASYYGWCVANVGVVDGSIDHLLIWTGVLRVWESLTGGEDGELVAEFPAPSTETEEGFVRAWWWDEFTPMRPPMAISPITGDHELDVVPRPLTSVEWDGWRFRPTADGLYRTADGVSWERVFPSSE